MFADREPPDRADERHDDDLGSHAVDDLADGFPHERTPRRHPVRILGSQEGFVRGGAPAGSQRPLLGRVFDDAVGQLAGGRLFQGGPRLQAAARHPHSPADDRDRGHAHQPEDR